MNKKLFVTTQGPHPPLRGTFALAALPPQVTGALRRSPQEGKENKDLPSPLGRGQGEGPELLQLFVLCCLALSIGCGKKDPVLARVGSRAVTASAFLREVEGVPFSSQTYLKSPSGRKELLELLIRRKIILAEAENRPPTQQGQTLLADLNRQYKNQQERLRLSYLEEKERLRVKEFTESLKKGPLNVTDEEVRTLWSNGKEVRASHILVSRRAQADEIRERISAGDKFEDLAKKHSEDTASAAKGGDAGYLLPGSLVPEFEKALFQMKTGEVSDVVTSPYGFHIIRRTGDRPLSGRPLNDALKSTLRQSLENQKLQTWFSTVRERHTVRIDEEKLNDVVFTAPSPSDPPGTPNPRQ
ncbi:MAG: peptidylprolyl isomerase [Elusimicrobia bacterium]|nr:peptidylprolyl isomerase [Elusimicrobiota bacterium]